VGHLATTGETNLDCDWSRASGDVDRKDEDAAVFGRCWTSRKPVDVEAFVELLVLIKRPVLAGIHEQAIDACD
jgi:hypothetical protein